MGRARRKGKDVVSKFGDIIFECYDERYLVTLNVEVKKDTRVEWEVVVDEVLGALNTELNRSHCYGDNVTSFVTEGDQSLAQLKKVLLAELLDQFSGEPDKLRQLRDLINKAFAPAIAADVVLRRSARLSKVPAAAK